MITGPFGYCGETAHNTHVSKETKRREYHNANSLWSRVKSMAYELFLGTSAVDHIYYITMIY